MRKDGSDSLSPVVVRISSFQSVEDVELEIRGFTCITGKSNIGKSAIVRAIAGALQNAPVVGDVRKGAKFCSVTIKSENWGFRWEKGEKGGGTYYFDGNNKIFDKIGQGQIEEIVKLGFGTVKVGDDTIEPWLAPQWEPIFLLNRSGPAVTDFISGVSRLHVLQDAIVLSLRGKKKFLDEVKTRTEVTEKLRVKEAAVAGLDAMIRVARELEGQAQSIDEYEARKNLAENLFRKMNQARAGISLLSPIEDAIIPEPPAAQVMKRLKSCYSHWKKCDGAAKSILQIRAISGVQIPEAPHAEMARLKSAVKHTVIFKLKQTVETIQDIGNVNIPHSDVNVDIDRMKKASSHLKKIHTAAMEVQRLSAVIPNVQPPPDLKKLVAAKRHWLSISAISQEIAEMEKNLIGVSTELAKVQDELSSIPSCSACGRPIANRHSHENIKTA